MEKKLLLLCFILLSGIAFSQITYYSKSTGNLNTLATWGTNTNGTGTSPANFTSANVTYIIVNQAVATISSNWTVSGTNSRVQVGDATQTVNFSIPSTNSFIGNISIMNNATLSNASNSNPTITAANVGSTVVYSRSGSQTVAELAYYNLILSGSGSKSLANITNTSVAGNLNINTGINFVLNTIQTLTLSLNGTVSGTGLIKGGNSSNLSIGGSGGNLGTITFGGALSLYKFTLNRPGGNVTLASNLTVANAFTHTSGVLSLTSNTLTLNGAVTFPVSAATGSFSGSATSSLIIAGTGSITNSLFMTQSGTANYFKDFDLNRSGQMLTLGNTLKLVGTLTPYLGVFNSAGNLVLTASSYSLTARIGTIGSGASVVGNVTVQTFARGGNTGWTTMGAAGISGRTFSDWNDNFAITCLTCPNGYNVGGSNFGSIVMYNETTGGLYNNAARYTEIQNITDPITIGKGFWVYLGNGTITTTDIIIDISGSVTQGNFPFTVTNTNIGAGTVDVDHGYNLIANPFPCPIQWSLLRNNNANVSDAIYAYNPDLNGYASYVNGVSSPPEGAGGIGDFIPAGQGFYIKASATTTLTAMETNKGQCSQPLLRMNGSQQTSSTTKPLVFRLQASGASMQNETAIYFDPNATTNYDTEYDALYMGVDYGKLGVSTSLGGYSYAINGLPTLNQNFSIPVNVTTGITSAYQIAATDLQNIYSGACLILHDNYMNTDQDLRSAPYLCTITDTETVARFVLNITINNNLPVTANIFNPNCTSSADGFAVANAVSAGPWNYYWKDASNNIVKTSLNKNSPDTLFNLNAGNYRVDINTAGTCDNGSQTFSLTPLTAPSASFSSASSFIMLNDTVSVSFNNTSSNANTYWWNFGDGNGSADTNAINTYASSGTFTVTLTAYNNTCNDSILATQLITIVDGGTGMGISSYPAPNKNMYINRDALGYYVQFNYKEKTNAVITVHNLLGEKVIADLGQKNISREKVYIPLGKTENNILILSVVTEAGEKAYCKIVNY